MGDASMGSDSKISEKGMKWLKGDDYYLRTEDDNWRIAKALTDKRVHYTLWRKNEPPKKHGAWGAIVMTASCDIGDIDARNAALTKLQNIVT
jgi:hypothetical protein